MKKNGSNKEKSVSVTMPIELDRKLEDLALRQSESKMAIMRTALRHYMMWIENNEKLG